MKPGTTLTLAAAAVLVGSLLADWAFQLPATPLGRPAVPAADLPEVPNAEPLYSAYRRLAERFPKGADGASPARLTQAQAWTLKGVVREGAASYALIERDRRILRVTLGEPLPDGAILDAVGADGIRLKTPSGEASLRLYRTGTE
jgi:hypothetical protein